MTTQLLAQAVATAYSPHSSAEELLGVIGDLVTFGSLDAADEALGKLRAQGHSLPLVTRLEKVVAWLRELGPLFEEWQLAGAIEAVWQADATDEQLRKAAGSLVVWGALDEADIALSRLKERGVFPGPVARLSAASAQLRRSGILEELQTLTPQTSLNKPYEVLIKRRLGAQRVIVVFTGAAFRFWISLNALHIFLRRLDAHLIYLCDHTVTMYLNGLRSIGPDYQSMMRMLREQLGLLAPRELYVLATSAGGFAGLRAAMELEADGFAGMSIRTDLSPSSPIQTSPVERYVINACQDPLMLIDLRPLVEASKFPRRIQLYCGGQKIDIAHTENLRGIPRVEINYLDSYERHDAISGLIAGGTFETMLNRFINASPEQVTDTCE